MTAAEQAERLRVQADHLMSLRHWLDDIATRNGGELHNTAVFLEEFALRVERNLMDIADAIDPPRIVPGQAWLREIMEARR